VSCLLNIVVRISEQSLCLMNGSQLIKKYRVNTAKNGLGEQHGSECTPRGKHIIRAKVGDGAPLHSVFVGRRLTGEIFNAELAKIYPKRDWILTRILWLSGVEKGINRQGDVDTMRRFIYIHGAPDDLVNMEPSSHGCVRMRNLDVLDLFERVPIYTPVLIK
jgi:L,D-transpeptidase YbiS